MGILAFCSNIVDRDVPVRRTADDGGLHVVCGRVCGSGGAFERAAQTRHIRVLVRRTRAGQRPDRGESQARATRTRLTICKSLQLDITLVTTNFKLPIYLVDGQLTITFASFEEWTVVVEVDVLDNRPKWSSTPPKLAPIWSNCLKGNLRNVATSAWWTPTCRSTDSCSGDCCRCSSFTVGFSQNYLYISKPSGVQLLFKTLPIVHDQLPGKSIYLPRRGYWKVEMYSHCFCRPCIAITVYFCRSKLSVIWHDVMTCLWNWYCYLLLIKVTKSLLPEYQLWPRQWKNSSLSLSLDAERFNREILSHMMDSYALALNLNVHILQGTEQTVSRLVSNYLVRVRSPFFCCRSFQFAQQTGWSDMPVI